MPSDRKVRFLCDRNLGRLAKWLRIMGYDAQYMHDWDEGRIEDAVRSSRTVLTRKRTVSGRRGVVFIEDNDLRGQLLFLDRLFGIRSGARPLTRCCVCNGELESIRAEEARENLPEYVWITQEKFSKCPLCKRIYWSGSHAARIEEELNSLFES